MYLSGNCGCQNETGLGFWEELAQIGSSYLNKRAADTQAGAAVDVANAQLQAQRETIASTLAMQDKQLAAEMALARGGASNVPIQSLTPSLQAAINQTPPGYQPVVVQRPGTSPQVVYQPADSFPPWIMYAALGGAGLIGLFIVLQRRRGFRR